MKMGQCIKFDFFLLLKSGTSGKQLVEYIWWGGLELDAAENIFLLFIRRSWIQFLGTDRLRIESGRKS